MTWVCPTGAVGSRNVLSPSTLKRHVCEVWLYRDRRRRRSEKAAGRRRGRQPHRSHDSEQPEGCVVDGEGEWCRGSAPQERWGHATCSLPQPSNATSVRWLVIATDGGGGQRKLRGGGEGFSRTAYDSEQPVVCVVDSEGEWCRGSGPQERCGHTTCPSTLKLSLIHI